MKSSLHFFKNKYGGGYTVKKEFRAKQWFGSIIYTFENPYQNTYRFEKSVPVRIIRTKISVPVPYRKNPYHFIRTTYRTKKIRTKKSVPTYFSGPVWIFGTVRATMLMSLIAKPFYIKPEQMRPNPGAIPVAPNRRSTRSTSENWIPSSHFASVVNKYKDTWITWSSDVLFLCIQNVEKSHPV